MSRLTYKNRIEIYLSFKPHGYELIMSYGGERTIVPGRVGDSFFEDILSSCVDKTGGHSSVVEFFEKALYGTNKAQSIEIINRRADKQTLTKIAQYLGISVQTCRATIIRFCKYRKRIPSFVSHVLLPVGGQNAIDADFKIEAAKDR